MTAQKKDALCFVQFLHPGGEHKPDVDNSKPWNRGTHKRKYLINDGAYVSNTQGLKYKAKLGFWGEWEPESYANRITDPLPYGPQYIHQPYYIAPESYQGLQNTDPFVFGERFLYTICQQNRKTGSTQLRNLAKGSVVLFGSCLKEKFVLDTVFVIDHWVDHCKDNFRSVLNGYVSETYKKVTLLPMYCSGYNCRGCATLNKTASFRLYFGATFDNPVHGMFSFFPTQLVDCYPKGFARPAISISKIITDSLNQSMKLNSQKDLGSIQGLWRKVVEIVTSANLKLGVWTELPQSRQH